MRVEPVTQVPHDLLPDPGGLVGLQDADGAVDDRDDGHDGDQDDEQMNVGAAMDEQGLVEHHLDQQRVDDADRRGHHDQPDDGGHLYPVRAKQRHYPAGGVPVRVGGRGRVPVGRRQRPRGCHGTHQQAGGVSGSSPAPAYTFMPASSATRFPGGRARDTPAPAGPPSLPACPLAKSGRHEWCSPSAGACCHRSFANQDHVAALPQPRPPAPGAVRAVGSWRLQCRCHRSRAGALVRGGSLVR